MVTSKKAEFANGSSQKSVRNYEKGGSVNKRLPPRELKMGDLDLDEKAKLDLLGVDEGTEVEGIIELKPVLMQDMVEAQARWEVLMAFVSEQLSDFSCSETLVGARKRSMG